MKVDMTGGQPTVEARDIGELFDLSVQEVQTRMRAGEITSRFETGEDEDAGKVRLTFFYMGQKVRLTCANDGTVLTTTRVSMG